MKFLDRSAEMKRLDALTARAGGGLAVVYGRRRVGKTRLLLEWAGKHGGCYSVADQSVPPLQRRYFAEAMARELDGFADVEYRDWRGLLSHLAREARSRKWRGPVVIDELPYLVSSNKELPSVLQQWIDHEARASHLVVALAGSTQRMMQGLVVPANAPLYGRAVQILELKPLDPWYLRTAFDVRSTVELMEHYAAWGGIPRYWELASFIKRGVELQIDELVLDPMGPLHGEPDRLLLDEVPPAVALRPVLDVIGAGVHRISEIAGRMGQPATSLARPLDRLVGMGLVVREVPYGQPPRSGKRSLYKISDPFFRLWFRVVAPRRALLAHAPRTARLELLRKQWPYLVAAAWEDVCREKVASVDCQSPLGRLGPWGPGCRFWEAGGSEWDLVAESLDGRRLLLGEVKWARRPLRAVELQKMAHRLLARAIPISPRAKPFREIVRAIFVPETSRGAAASSPGVLVVSGKNLLRPPR